MKLLFERPKIFIGSASESLDVAFAIQRNLAREFNAVAWPDSNFTSSKSTLSSLLKFVKEFDFAIFILSQDDETIIRNRRIKTARSNVIFELGMFFGALGEDRTFFVTPRDPYSSEPPSDLYGISGFSYDISKFKENINAALRDVCTQISVAIENIGLSPAHYFRALNVMRRMPLILIDDLTNGSPLALDSLISRARKEIFIAAQNHYHILIREEKWFKQKLFEFLKSDPENRRIRILLCDPDNRSGVEAWSSLFQKSNDYEKHLKIAYKNLENWIKEAKESGLRLEAACISLMPVSINFVDPEDEQGLAVITPNLFEYRTKARSAYLITKTENGNTFQKYWLACEYAFENPNRRIDMVLSNS